MITDKQFREAHKRVKREYDDSLWPWVYFFAAVMLGVVIVIAGFILYLTSPEWGPVADRWAIEHSSLLAFVILSACVVMVWRKMRGI